MEYLCAWDDDLGVVMGVEKDGASLRASDLTNCKFQGRGGRVFVAAVSSMVTAGAPGAFLITGSVMTLPVACVMVIPMQRYGTPAPATCTVTLSFQNQSLGNRAHFSLHLPLSCFFLKLSPSDFASFLGKTRWGV